MPDSRGATNAELLDDVDQVITDLEETARAAEQGDVFEWHSTTDHVEATAAALLRLASPC